jgi:hypothetical protein
MSETERLRAKKKQIYEDLKDAVERECVDSLYERIKLLEQRVIDLQGHDDLSYIDKKLNEQKGE